MSLFLSFVASCAAANGPIRVVDAGDGSPVDAVAVFDASGLGLGLTSADGSLPGGAAGATSVTLRHVAFETAEVSTDTVADGLIRLMPRTFVLPEVSATSDPEYIRVEGYFRSYSSFGNEMAMGTGFAEGAVVYYLKPDKKGRAKDSGKTYGSVIYEHIVDRKEGIDSLRIRTGQQGKGMADMMDEGLCLPLLAETKEFAGADITQPFTELPGKYSALGSVRNNGSTITVTADKLSSHKGHSYSPFLLKMIGLTADCIEWTHTQTYDASAPRPLGITSLVSTSESVRIRGRGKVLKKIFGGEEIDMRIMTEMFVTDISYLDREAADEARKTDASMAGGDAPASLPPLDPVAAALRAAALDACK